MNVPKVIKAFLLGSVYGINLLFALALWLCGMDGNIMLGIIFIVFYRLSLWFAPLAVTVIYWLPFGTKATLPRKLLFYSVHLLLCGSLFLICHLVFGNWY